MIVVGQSCYEDVRATPLNYLYYKFFYEDVRANAPYDCGGSILLRGSVHRTVSGVLGSSPPGGTPRRATAKIYGFVIFPKYYVELGQGLPPIS